MCDLDIYAELRYCEKDIQPWIDYDIGLKMNDVTKLTSELVAAELMKSSVCSSST